MVGFPKDVSQKGAAQITDSTAHGSAGKLAFMDEIMRAPLDEIIVRVRKWVAKHRFRKAVSQVWTPWARLQIYAPIFTLMVFSCHRGEWVSKLTVQ